MTPEQFRNWRDFALRMARTCYAESRRPSCDWLVEQVQEFLDRVEGEADTIVDWDSPPAYVCDSASEFVWGLQPAFRWRLRARDVSDQDEDRRAELAEAQWEEQWGDPIRCCIRAGLDLASAPSAGVVGFTVGDLRSMYPEGLPAWLDAGFCDATGAPVSLTSLPEDSGVWL